MEMPVYDLQFGGARRTPYIQQSEASECGLACLAMVAGYHGYETDLASLRRRFPISLKGATLRQLLQIGEELGLSVHALRGEVEDLEQVALPAVLHWNLNHFVVLSRIRTRLGKCRYQILDPGRGSLEVDRDELSRRFTGVLLEVRKSESFRRRRESSELRITQLWSSMSGHWQSVRQLALLSVILQATALATPMYMQIAVDSVVPAFDRDFLLVLALGFGGLAVINLMTGWLRSLLLVSLNNSLSYQVIVNLFQHLSRLPLTWFEKRHVGDIVSRFGSTRPITQLLSEGLIASLIDGVMALLTLTLMFVFSPGLTALAVAALLLYIAIRIGFLQALRLRNVDAISASARENSTFIETVRGMSAIKAFGQEANRQRVWQRTKSEAVNAEIKLGRLSAGFDASGQFIVAVERVLFVYLAINAVMDARMTIGIVFAFQSYKQQFLDAGIRLVEQAINLSILRVHLGRLSDIALSRTEDAGRKSVAETPDYSGPIELRDIRFRYGIGEPEILAGVTLRIAPGEMVSFIGPSGGGKTTLGKIITGLIDPSHGQVLINGRDAATFARSRLRRGVASVAQDDVLYAGSLAENIAFFDPEMNFEKVVEAARLACIAPEIDAMPMQYETLVGDMGSALSGGQRQRILLARALYANPRLLFMDEGTANLDPITEAAVLRSLRSLPITRILIAHRPELAAASDSVFLVAGGQVKRVERKEAQMGP